MTTHLAWYVARASGVVAWLLLSAAVVWGLFLSTRLTRRRPTPRWLLDLHRFLGGLAVVFVAVHIAGLVADNYVHFGVADILVPMASGWRPVAVALGVVAFWVLLAVELTSLLMSRLPRKLWHGIHLSSYVLFWMTTLHGLLSGTDAKNPYFVVATDVMVGVVTVLSVFRGVVGKRASGARARVAAARDARGAREGRSPRPAPAVTAELPRLPSRHPAGTRRMPAAGAAEQLRRRPLVERRAPVRAMSSIPTRGLPVLDVEDVRTDEPGDPRPRHLDVARRVRDRPQRQPRTWPG